MQNNNKKINYKDGWITSDLYLFIDNRILNNSFILTKNKKSIIIDPSFNAKKIISFIKNQKLKVDGILITHGHFDHLGQTIEILKEFDTNFYLQINDAKICETSKSMLFGKIDEFLISKIVTFNNKLPKIQNWEELNVLHTPGHTPGSSCYYNDKYVFSGDHIFDVDIGRTDFEFSDEKLMQISIKNFINQFKNKNMTVFPGHEEWTEVDNLKNINKYTSKFF